MTLNVPFDHFSKTVDRVLGTKDAYIQPVAKGCLITAGGEKGYVVASHSKYSKVTVKTKLEQCGMTAFDGFWTLNGASEIPENGGADAYLAAVAYKTGEPSPGVWVNAFATCPTQVQVLRALYDEFRETGEIGDVSFEEFVRLSEPNVVIVTPNEVQSFLEKKPEC